MEKERTDEEELTGISDLETSDRSSGSTLKDTTDDEIDLNEGETTDDEIDLNEGETISFSYPTWWA